MTCLACGKVHPDAIEVRLHDGRVVSSYSEEWRQEAEARAVLAMKTKPERWSFMMDVKQRRGQKTHDELHALVVKLFAMQRAAG